MLLLLTDPGSAPDPASETVRATAAGTTVDLTGKQIDPADEDLVAAALAWPTDTDRITVRANMVASLDGGTTLDGTSGGLGSPVDQRLIGIQRDLADVILVGAGTVISEGYPGTKSYPRRLARRERWGRSGLPRWVIVASRPLPAGLKAVVESEVPPLVLSPDDVEHAEGVEVIRTGSDLDLAVGLAQLAERGVRRVLCEGGPTLLGRLESRALLDEISLTLSPTLLGAGAPVPLLGGMELRDPSRWSLVSLFADGGHLFPRYRRRR
ncbi:MAG: dihydrofolate reductase family protein [Nakamurella sp.]